MGDSSNFVSSLFNVFSFCYGDFFIFLVKFIANIHIFVNETDLAPSFLATVLFVYTKAIDFCVLISYPSTLPSLLV